MQNTIRKLKEFNQRPYKRRELYLQLAFPWLFAGLFIAAGVTMVDTAISSESPIWLVIVILVGIIYITFCLCYAGIEYLKPYMDGIYQQHLKEYEERSSKAENKNG